MTLLHPPRCRWQVSIFQKPLNHEVVVDWNYYRLRLLLNEKEKTWSDEMFRCVHVQRNSSDTCVKLTRQPTSEPEQCLREIANTRQHHNSSNECEKWPRLATEQIEHCLRKSAKTGNITIGAIPARNLPRLLETSQVIPAMPAWNCKKVRNSKKMRRNTYDKLPRVAP